MIALAAGPSLAADTAPSAPEAAGPLQAARALIADKKWAAAIEELKRVDDKASADWNNLMGYSLRKGKTPDFTGAAKYYDAALRIDPKHRSALEYSGELYLMTKNLPQAEQRLAARSRRNVVAPSPLGEISCYSLPRWGRVLSTFSPAGGGLGWGPAR